MRWRVRSLLLLVTLFASGCASGPTFDQVSASLPPPPAGTARIFVYRDIGSYQELSWVPVFFNGGDIGAVGPGKVLMRDVVPGTYTISAKSEGLWPDQDKTVIVAPGQTIYAKIEVVRSLDPTRDRPSPLATYVVVLVDTVTGRREIGGLWYSAASGPTRVGAG
jgi:uncharacterized protein DUF2846